MTKKKTTEQEKFFAYVGSLVLTKESLANDPENNPNFVVIKDTKKSRYDFHKIVNVILPNTIITDDGLEIRIEEWKRKE
jgi:hypothetical protein